MLQNNHAEQGQQDTENPRGTRETPDTSNHRGGGGNVRWHNGKFFIPTSCTNSTPTSTYAHKFIFTGGHPHMLQIYTRIDREISFLRVRVLRVKKAFIFSEWSAEAGAVQIYFVFLANGRERWPLWPCDEYRVHFPWFPFFNACT